MGTLDTPSQSLPTWRVAGSFRFHARTTTTENGFLFHNNLCLAVCVAVCVALVVQVDLVMLTSRW